MLSDNEIDCVLDPATGLTCRQRVTRDKTAVSDGSEKIAMGKLYYATLRSIYQTTVSIEKQLQLKPEQQVSDEIKHSGKVSKEDLQGLCNVLQRQRIPSSQE
eukprot:1035165-Amphidinium_carterae.1